MALTPEGMSIRITELQLANTKLKRELNETKRDLDTTIDRSTRYQELGRKYLNEYTSEKTAHTKTTLRLTDTQEDLLMVIRQLRLTGERRQQ